MSKPMNRDLLSVGAVLIILVLVIVLYVSSIISQWETAGALFIILCGIWILALAEMQSANPQKYARSAYGLAIWGILMIAVGAAWFVAYYDFIYAIVILLLTCAAVALFTALRRR